ncbi:MAG TPA: FHA domain-containing protein [Trebonia sp.]|nr:FHA domain-containing protein [Trebonia sp.]
MPGSLVVEYSGGSVTLVPGQVYQIGRNPAADLVVDVPGVSWRHAELLVKAGQWLIRDLGSSYGTFCAGQPVRHMKVAGNVQLRLGDPDTGPLLSCRVTGSVPARAAAKPASGSPATPSSLAIRGAPAALGAPATPGSRATPGSPATAVRRVRPAANRMPSEAHRMLGRPMLIGRANGNDVVIPDLLVARRHAELRALGDGRFQLTDVGSHSGTFVNGRRIKSVAVTEDDVIGIGTATFRLAGDELQEFDAADGVLLEARGLTVTLPGGKVLLDDVTFPLPERCLLGVIGPSGAGKSTLLGALTGIRPASTGSVLYDGRDLYANYAELRHHIGLVPQENILHSQLTARRGLSYAARLRFSRDTSREERSRRVDEVLGELSLAGHADTRTGSLSGGQRKRVNVALELLTKPSLLFLDEPTSGLDPGLDKSVMELLARLAADGRTVVVVTHSVANLASCDRLLVLVPGGKVAFFGTPADGLRHFRRADWAEVFQDFEAEPDRDWAADYRRSVYHARYIGVPLHAMGAAQERAQERPARAAARARLSGTASPRPASRLSQALTLVRRYLSVIAADRNYVGAMALLPVILGVLVRAIPDAGGLVGTDNGLAIQMLIILVMSACLTGVANGVRELVKERPIYARERAAGLSPGAYLVSKIAVLGVISAVQSVVLVAIGLSGRKMPPRGVLIAQPLIEIVIAVAGLAVASMTIGLLISAAVSSADKTVPLLVGTVLVQVILCGGVIRLNSTAGLEQLAWLSPSRWGLAALGATVNLNHVVPPPAGNTPDPLWHHSVRAWADGMTLQLVLAAVFARITLTLLRRPGRR